MNEVTIYLSDKLFSSNFLFHIMSNHSILLAFFFFSASWYLRVRNLGKFSLFLVLCSLLTAHCSLFTAPYSLFSFLFYLFSFTFYLPPIHSVGRKSGWRFPKGFG